MKTAVIGGGILGLTLAHRLSRRGHSVEVFESGSQLGGLAQPQDYGLFVWDRFYHCILPHDEHLLGLLRELGLERDLRWAVTKTGYFGSGNFYSMSSNLDFLRFPLLGLIDKMRMGAAVVYATRFTDPFTIYGVTAKDWLTKLFGRRNYKVFWEPLLKAKLGTYYDKVSAVFLWATLKRLFGARKGTANKEKLGYVTGGYGRILERFSQVLNEQGVKIHLAAPVTSIRPAANLAGAPSESDNRSAACEVKSQRADGSSKASVFDLVLFTAPPRVARKVVSPELLPHVERMEAVYPTSSAYLGVACGVFVLREPLTPYYVLNLADPDVELTGLIEMTNLVDSRSETAGRSLVYLPRYVDSEDAVLRESDGNLLEGFVERGLQRLFPDFTEDKVFYRAVHRAQYVQPLPLASAGAVKVEGAPELAPPFQMLGTFMLRCATLNNNEVVALVEEFVRKNEAALGPERPAAAELQVAAGAMP